MVGMKIVLCFIQVTKGGTMALVDLNYTLFVNKKVITKNEGT